MLRPNRIGPARALRRARSTVAGLLVLFAALAFAPTAIAKPKGEFAVFANCPLSTPGVNECVYSQSTGGELAFGTMKVPIMKPITLQGGLIVTEKGETFVNATEGMTLSKTPENVPGGFEGLAVTVTLELVGTVAMSRSNLAAGKGVALTLPVRAHLNNPFFGETCFIGSSTSPITLNLTTGATSPPPPNKSIKGSPGTLETREEGTLRVYAGDVLVDNAFSVPGAKGCGGAFEAIINPIINSKFGLPSAAGHNSTILSGTSKFATAEAVKKSE